MSNPILSSTTPFFYTAQYVERIWFTQNAKALKNLLGGVSKGENGM